MGVSPSRIRLEFMRILVKNTHSMDEFLVSGNLLRPVSYEIVSALES